MFNISKKGIYGLSAIYKLGLMYNQSQIQIKEIADSQNIPQHYLEQLLVILKKYGFIVSVRGAQGGYMLAKNPNEIKIIDVLECLEGKITLSDDLKSNEGLGFFWWTKQQEIKELFQLSLADLMQMKNKSEKRSMYYI